MPKTGNFSDFYFKKITFSLSSDKMTEKQLKLILDAVKFSQATNIAIVLPPYRKSSDKYQQSELTNISSQRAIIAKFSCQNQLTIIDP